MIVIKHNQTILKLYGFLMKNDLINDSEAPTQIFDTLKDTIEGYFKIQ